MKGSNDDATHFVRDKNAALRFLKEKLQRAQKRMKLYTDKRRTERELEDVDQVYLKLQPYKQVSVAQRPNQKLAAKYYNPYKVIQRNSETTYQVKFLTES